MLSESEVDLLFPNSDNKQLQKINMLKNSGFFLEGHLHCGRKKSDGVCVQKTWNQLVRMHQKTIENIEWSKRYALPEKYHAGAG